MMYSDGVKIQRTGIAEAILQYDRWLKDNGKPYLLHVEDEFINWLYTTSGWYDREVRGTYFDIDVEQVKNSAVYQVWIQQFAKSLRDCDYLEIMLWNHWREAYFKEAEPFYKEFVKSFNPKDDSLNESSPYYNYWDNPEKMFPLLHGRVLLLNPMSPLFLQQYDNAHKVYPTMPHFEPIIHTFPYCFFNKGEDRNGFETLNRIFEELPKDFDIALISIGSYGCLMAEKLQAIGKNTVTVGSGIPKLFAIQPGREEKHWLSVIPDEFIPEGYEKIENGRYWKG
jgi:hypothetical protein